MTYEHRLIGAPDEAWHPEYTVLPLNPIEQLRDIEAAGVRKYRNDPVFHAHVVIGANIIRHRHPVLDPAEARHTALMVIAASQQEIQ